ncbi:MAG TPA: Holliday junction branch migration protein RuvA [Lachnospiraceae bacterium]|nr:Holliday junction branch migration protein RuvA [Lachnospiraceae bacterium]HPF30356.1 Holliday junction branch migration protein RuvA [Lachnospiraceae bacterium]
MYAYFKGILEEKNIDRIVIEVGGIGYNIYFPAGKAAMLPALGEEVKIYIYTNVREDAINLFGFISLEELELFKLLISVSGIGPKGGLSILSIMSADEVKMAILTGNAKAISKAPGVGNKTAERLLIDLKDKVSVDSILGHTIEEGNVAGENDPIVTETIEALTALGYAMKEAQNAVVEARKERDATDTSDLLKAALKLMSR